MTPFQKLPHKDRVCTTGSSAFLLSDDTPPAPLAAALEPTNPTSARIYIEHKKRPLQNNSAKSQHIHERTEAKSRRVSWMTCIVSKDRKLSLQNRRLSDMEPQEAHASYACANIDTLQQ